MSFLVTPQGFRIRYADRGDSRRAIVLVHGWKGSHRLWDRTITALEDRFRVVAFDLRGMGESDKPKTNYDFQELSSDLGFVISELDLSALTLVGWSMGCTVSLEYMKRDASRVSKLTLVAGPITRAHDFFASMKPDHLRNALDNLSNHWPTRERSFIKDYFLQPHPDLVDWMYSIALQSPLSITLRVARHQSELDYREFLSTIAVPTLAIYGRHDPHCPPELAEYIAKQVPRGEYAIFEQSRHLPFLEEADRFTDVLAEFASRP